MPALAAWTAFLLCRYLTRSLWPSIVGGYLFGFSSYLLAQDGYGGHLNLGAVFLLPLIVLAILRYLDGRLDARGLVLRLAPLVRLADPALDRGRLRGRRSRAVHCLSRLLRASCPRAAGAWSR